MTRFKVLAKSHSYEVRKYNPQRRTITVCGKSYFLPFPYIVFGCHVYCNRGYLFCAFAKKDDDWVYWPSIPNVWDNYWVCCLGGSGGGHFSRIETDIKVLISLFWQTEFRGISTWNNSDLSLRINYGSFHSWTKLNLEAAVDALDSQQKKLDDFLNIVKTTPHTGIRY